MKPSTNTPTSPGFYWVRDLEDGSAIRVVKVEDRGDGKLAFASQTGIFWVPLGFGFEWGEMVECPWKHPRMIQTDADTLTELGIDVPRGCRAYTADVDMDPVAAKKALVEEFACSGHMVGDVVRVYGKKDGAGCIVIARYDGYSPS
jgi:hypothetical protein